MVRVKTHTIWQECKILAAMYVQTFSLAMYLVNSNCLKAFLKYTKNSKKYFFKIWYLLN